MNLIRWTHIFLILAVLVVGSSLMAGCGTQVRQDVQSTTKGQELQDLEAARKQGLITDKEFEKQKKKILKRR